MKNKNWEVIHAESSKWARWIALYEAVNLICDKAEERNIALENIRFDPLDIRDYVSSTEDIILRKILKEEHNIDVSYSEENAEKNQEYQFV